MVLCWLQATQLFNTRFSSSLLTKILPGMAAERPSSDMAAFRQEVKDAKHVLILSGAGVSAESGVPTFRGAGGYWRKWQAQQLATPEAFSENPSLVWEFYHHRREVMNSKHPNAAHKAIADYEERMTKEGKNVVVVTQNIDELHKKAGSKNIIELHGTLFKIRCTVCGEVCENRDSPICEALHGKGEPDPSNPDAAIPAAELPRCGKCNGLARPHVVWFGEGLDKDVTQSAAGHIDLCDLCLMVGTSSVVYPAAMYAPQVALRGVTVAEFNLESTPATDCFKYHFEGPAGTFLPQALAPF
uniref:NAD-dependent protein deacylase n=1 Tax=Phallusia mammillata TaxID=59560 RepID=A0A6F9DRL2_9ASCI|nr:NAD-dependent protein deacylase-like [Phallusia mammillata]